MGPGGWPGPRRTVTAVRQFVYAGYAWQVDDEITVDLNVARQMIEAGNAVPASGWSLAGPIQEAWSLTYFQQPDQP